MTTPNFKGLKLFAHRIDEQLCDIVHKQLVKAIEEIESGLAETYKPESQAFIMFVFYTFSLYLDRPTPGMLAMNLTFSPSETIIGGDPKATTSVAGTSMSQLGAADSLKSLYTLVMSLVKKSFHFRTLLKSEKAGVQGGDLTESGGKNVYRAMKAYRFIAIVAYVSSVWAMRRAQRKALLEGAEAHFSLNTDPLSTSETIQNLFYFNKCIFINSYTLINLLSNHVRAVNVTGWRTAREGSRKKKLWKALRVVEFVTKIIDISNICTFFINGVFPSLLYRILNIKTVPVGLSSSTTSNTSIDGIPGYSHVQLYVRSRQLLWQVLSGFLTAVTMSVDFRNIVTQGNEFGLRMVNTLCLILQKVGRDSRTVLRRITGNFRVLGARESIPNRNANSYESNYFNNSTHSSGTNTNTWDSSNVTADRDPFSSYTRHAHPLGTLGNNSGSSSASSSSSDVHTQGHGQGQGRGQVLGHTVTSVSTSTSTAHSVSHRLSSLCTSTTTAASAGLRFLLQAVLTALRHADDRLRKSLIFVLRIILRRP